MIRDPGRRSAPEAETPPRPLANTILQLIWRERQISRADIARHFELARSTVSEIMTSLLATGLVAEAGPGESRGGRRPIVLEFQDDACVLLGVEVGAAHVGVALTNLRGKVLHWEARSHAVREDPPGTRALIAALCDTALEATGADPARLVGLGIAMPAPIDPSNPGEVSEIVLPAWEGHTGLEFLGDRFGVPLFVDNDANLGALAEQWWGEGRGVQNFSYIKVATGIGAGHVIEGELYRGATGMAGEIGHMAIDPSGGPCMCGLNGCLATFVGARALERRAQALRARYPGTTLPPRPDINTIEAAALDGDPLAVHVAREAAEYLGIALAGMLNLMNPARIILGGELSGLGDLVLEPVRETVRSRTLVNSVAAARITTSGLGPKSVAIGAATQVLKAALEDARLFPAVAGEGVRS